MCELFIEKFSEKVIELAGICHCPSCGCQERLKVCKNPEHNYHHYPRKVAESLLKHNPPTPEIGQDVILSLIHGSEPLYVPTLYNLRRYIRAKHIPIIKNHWSCMVDHRLGYYAPNVRNGGYMAFNSWDEALSHGYSDINRITSFREWLREEFPKQLEGLTE